MFAVGRSKRWDLETNALGMRLPIRVRVGEGKKGIWSSRQCWSDAYGLGRGRAKENKHNQA